MSPTAQRIALAGLSNWAKCPFDEVSYYVPMQGKAAVACDPLNDLNAVHELLSILTDEQWTYYWDTLCDVTKAEKCNDWGKVFTDPKALLRATAAQRCEAILRTLNLWDDNK